MGELSCKSVEVGRSVWVLVSALVPVAADFWTTSPSVGTALGKGEELVKVQSSAFVVSAEEEIVLLVM